jgi:hypothetical protein
MTFTHKELVFGRIYPEHPQHFFSVAYPTLKSDVTLWLPRVLEIKMWKPPFR